jgi:hypothetical protein
MTFKGPIGVTPGAIGPGGRTYNPTAAAALRRKSEPSLM